MGLGNPRECPWLSKPSYMSWCSALLWNAPCPCCLLWHSTCGFPVGKVLSGHWGEGRSTWGISIMCLVWMSGKTQCSFTESKRESEKVKKAMNRDCCVLGKRRLKENVSLQISKRLLSLEQDNHSFKFRSSFLRTKIMKCWKKIKNTQWTCGMCGGFKAG